ncbi:hypothetical protein EST38_g9478 [Candolleomyces aberdarensis]|uniref:Uncharacterized protein n=1 Tax=Candolleomyces aberdarensis TaxID=2316362 RepID=A0A4Q2D9T8_9AGAR|nr:hypothetical protein EST38_g9478 [Candolleomyces aberdarensis]
MRFVYFFLGLFVTQGTAVMVKLHQVQASSSRPLPPFQSTLLSYHWSAFSNVDQLTRTLAKRVQTGRRLWNSNAQDYSCVCTQDFTANFVACSECGLALSATVLPPDLQANLAQGADSYLQAIVYICKNAYNIDIPGGHVTAPDVAAPQHTA